MITRLNRLLNAACSKLELTGKTHTHTMYKLIAAGLLTSAWTSADCLAGMGWQKRHRLVDGPFCGRAFVSGSFGRPCNASFSFHDQSWLVVIALLKAACDRIKCTLQGHLRVHPPPPSPAGGGGGGVFCRSADAVCMHS